MSVEINVGSKLDAKGFKQAETALEKLNKQGKSLAKTLGYSFGTAAILRYGKNAVKAFADDQKAAKALTLTLNNLGMAFADPEVKRFISSLESQYGVLDDLLRPAYQKLLTTTGDYKKAQDLLKTSLDLSAMSGKDILTVTADLSKAYAGNTRGLIKYGLGLSKTEIAAMSFEQILARIAEVSKGQAEEAANSYSGSLDRLNVSIKNASESIGKDLFTALETLANGNGIPKTINLIETLSSGIGDAVIGVSRLIRNIGILASGNPIQSIKDLRAATASDKAIDRRDRAVYGGIYATQYQATAAKSASKTSAAAAQTKATKALTKATQDQLKLSKAKAIFDLQKIQIEAALKGKLSEEDRLRLLLMKAIENENISDIEKYTKLLTEAQAKAKELQITLDAIKANKVGDPFAELRDSAGIAKVSIEDLFSTFAASAAKAGTSIDAIVSKISMMTGVSLSNQIAMTSFAQGINAGLPTPEALSGARYAAQAAQATNVTVNVQGSVIAENDLAQSINDALAQSGWAGSAIGYSRQAVMTAV